MEVKVICTSAGNHDDLYDDAADGVCRWYGSNTAGGGLCKQCAARDRVYGY